MFFSLPSPLYFFFGSFLAYLPFVFPLSSHRSSMMFTYFLINFLGWNLQTPPFGCLRWMIQVIINPYTYIHIYIYIYVHIFDIDFVVFLGDFLHIVRLRTGSRAPRSPTGRNRWRRRARSGCPAQQLPRVWGTNPWTFLNGGDQQKFPITMVYNG